MELWRWLTETEQERRQREAEARAAYHKQYKHPDDWGIDSFAGLDEWSRKKKRK